MGTDATMPQPRLTYLLGVGRPQPRVVCVGLQQRVTFSAPGYRYPVGICMPQEAGEARESRGQESSTS